MASKERSNGEAFRSGGPIVGGLRVLELSDTPCYAIPYAGKLLADLGAEVVMVEGPAGHPLRHGHPGAFPDEEVAAAVFEFLSGRKQVVTASPGDETLQRLLSWADVVVASHSLHDLRDRGPSATVPRADVVVSPWGSDGPYRNRSATPLILQAASGWVNERKEHGQWPVQVGGQMHEWATGSFIAVAALTARRSVEQCGASVSVEMSMMECLHAMLCYDRLRFDARTEMNAKPERVVAAPFGIRQCVDGLVGINILTFQQWRQACLMTGLDDYIGNQAELSRAEGDVAGFSSQLDSYLADKTVNEILELGQAFRIPVVPVLGGDAVRSIPQWRERPFFEAQAGDAGRVVQPGPPWRASATRELLAGTGESADSSPARGDGSLPASALPASAPFAGLRILDLSHFWSGPYITMYLGAFGADVVKIESIQHPDSFRLNLTSPKLGETWYERGLFWQATNLDKRDITLDLTSAEGKALFFRLLADADVVIENYSPRVLDQFGLGYDALRAANPSIILVRLPGYGLEGPWRDYVGWGDAFEQLAGWAAVTGYPDGPPQTPGGYMDPMVAMHAGTALLAALRRRGLTGRGECIEVAQVEVGASMAAEQIIAGSLGRSPRRYGNRIPGYAPQGVYRCAGTEREFVALSIRDDAEWARLVTLMGSPPELQSAELASLAGRHAHHDEIDRLVGAWTATMIPQVVTALLNKAEIPATWLLRNVRFNDDPHLVHREFYELMTHPFSGPRLYPRFPMRFSFHEGPHHRLPPPTLGQHNREVLGVELGLSDEQLDDLERSRCIGTKLISG